MTTVSNPRPATEKEANEIPAGEIPFVADRNGIVRRGKYFVARARSYTMAKRIANALNQYTPNEKGE